MIKNLQTDRIDNICGYNSRQESLHDVMERAETPNYAVLGAAVLAAVGSALKAEAVDWDNQAISLTEDAQRAANTVDGDRAVDVLVMSTNEQQIADYRTALAAALGYEGASVSGLCESRKSKRALRGITGLCLDKRSGSLSLQGYRVVTSLPSDSLEPWLIKQDDHVLCRTLSPVAQLGLYMNQPIAGLHSQRDELVGEVRDLLMPHGKIGDVPAGYRNLYLDFLQHSHEVTRARVQKIGHFGLLGALRCAL